MVKLLSSVILILAIILFPPAVLAFVSQNAVPGDTTYPIKRKLEAGIIYLSSFNPTTKAWFSVTVSNRRFDESKTLLAQGKNADATLGELVVQTNTAVLEVNGLTDTIQKQKLKQDLQKSVSKYIVTLDQEQSQPTSQNTSSQLQQQQVTKPSPSVVINQTPTQNLPSNSPFASQQPSATPITSPSQSPEPKQSPPETTSDPDEICKNLPANPSTLNETIKKLCGIFTSQEETVPVLNLNKSSNIREDSGRIETKLENKSETNSCNDDKTYCDPNANPAQLIHKHGGRQYNSQSGCVYAFDRTGEPCPSPTH